MIKGVNPINGYISGVKQINSGASTKVESSLMYANPQYSSNYQKADDMSILSS